MRSIFLSCPSLSFATGRHCSRQLEAASQPQPLVIFHAQRPHFYRPHGRGEPNLLAHGTQRMQSGFVPSMTALSVPQHKPICTIAFGGSTRIDKIALGHRRKKSFSLQQRELAETSVALSTTCLSTSVPHSLGTCLETGIYTTGGGGSGCKPGCCFCHGSMSYRQDFRRNVAPCTAVRAQGSEHASSRTSPVLRKRYAMTDSPCPVGSIFTR